MDVGTHGCMPDYSTAHTSRRAAEAAAARYARYSREADNDRQVLGSAKRGRYDIYRRDGLRPSAWEPLQYIDIVDCCDDACYTESGDLDE